MIEQQGIDAVPVVQRHGRARDLFWPWAGSNLSLFGVAFGVYMVRLGLDASTACLAGVLGYALSFLLVGLVAVAGARTGLPTMALSRAAFGTAGNFLPASMSYVSNVGWETILVTLSALGGATVISRLTGAAETDRSVLAACFLAGAVLVTVVGVYGHALIVRVQRWLTWAFSLLTIVYAALTVPHFDLARVAALPSGGLATFVAGVVFAMTLLGLGWVNCGADYSRYLPADTPARSIAGWTTLGGALPPSLLLVLGVLLAGSHPAVADRAASDPVGALAAGLPTWFLVPYVVSATGGFLAGAIMDIYSSSLSLLALGAPLRRHQAAMADGVLMTAGGWYLLFVSPSFLATFQAFLAIIGVVMAAWVAIFLVEMRRPPAALVSVRWSSLVSLTVGTVLGLGLITSSDPLTAPIVGFLLPAEPGIVAASGVGVLVALVAAGACQWAAARYDSGGSRRPG